VERRRIRGFAKRISLLVERGGRRRKYRWHRKREKA
jgi:hypothetical protein